MEEFGLGSVEMVNGLSPFPGFGATGSVCGAVSGGLFVLGLYFGSDDLTDYAATGAAMTAARTFIPRFEATLGSTLCPKIQEDVVFGRYLDARASAEHMAAFQRELGYAKCALPAGIAARLAAEIIIESIEGTGAK
jgi:C_GCAxxG_C_C family probable redox protein